MTTENLRRWALISLVVIATACDTGGGNETAGIDRSGVRAPASVSGTVTGFGSVIVNGIRYLTSSATVEIDGAPSAETAVMVGHVVTVIAEIDADGNRTASRVSLLHDVAGPVEEVDPLAERLVVLGQPVLVDESTSFDGAIATRSLAGLAVGTRVQVSGFRSADGALHASRIELDGDTGPYLVHGMPTAVDTGARMLRINGLTVDYSTATLEGFPAGEPAVGDVVIVQGMTLRAGPAIVATRLVRTSAAPLDLSGAASTAEVEGLVTRFASASDFDVDGQHIVATAQTVYVRGTSADLALNARVEVRGTGASGVLTAAEVAFAPQAEIKMQGDVEAVDVASSTLRVLGTAVRVAADTAREDQRDEDHIFDLSDVVVGDQVELRGFEDPPGSNAVTATRLEREAEEMRAELTGFVRSLAEPEFFVLGVRVLTTPNTEFNDFTRGEFFARGVGWHVEVEGTYANGVLVADEIELAD